MGGHYISRKVLIYNPFYYFMHSRKQRTGTWKELSVLQVQREWFSTVLCYWKGEQKTPQLATYFYSFKFSLWALELENLGFSWNVFLLLYLCVYQHVSCSTSIHLRSFMPDCTVFMKIFLIKTMWLYVSQCEDWIM